MQAPFLVFLPAETPKSRRFGTGGFSVSKKPRRVRRPQAANKVEIIFCRGVYLTENTYQAASVRVVRCRRTRSARSRLQSFCQKRAQPFFDSLKLRQRLRAGADRFTVFYLPAMDRPSTNTLGAPKQVMPKGMGSSMLFASAVICFSRS